MTGRNPYHWQSSEPRIRIPRAEVGEIASLLCEGGSAMVLGGRGMGKSVFLSQLHADLESSSEGASSGLAVILIDGPPPRLDVEACLEQLARSLGVEVERPLNTREIVDAWFGRDDRPDRLILLFDEFDRYAEGWAGQLSPNPPGRAFFNDLELTRRKRRELGVMATGSVGVFAFRDALGSSFLSRAAHYSLGPFDRPTVLEMAGPFTHRDAPLSEAVLDALLLASGGVPALLTYGLQELWKSDSPADEREVARIYARFQDRHRGYLDDVHRAFADPALSGAPRRVLELLRQSRADLSRKVLEAACAEGDPLDLSLADVLEVLKASGLVRVEGSVFAGDPVRARPIPSLLNFPAKSPRAMDFYERLRQDLELLLSKLHRTSVDFFRPGPKKGQKRLVPESVFAAHLALGFELLGWTSEREAQSAAGRTDLKLRYNGGNQVALVEVKIWGRPGAKEAQGQIESDWTSGVAAGAVVQTTDGDVPEWLEVYRREALEGKGMLERRDLADSVLSACLSLRSEVRGMDVRVDHFLLGLPRR